MRILREETAAVLVDIQQRLVPAVEDGQGVVEAAAKLVKGLRILDVPIVVARQYPKGLGELAPELVDALGPHEPLDKLTFSVWDTEALAWQIGRLGRKTLLVFGVEAHVCVLQSVVDLIVAGHNVALVCDCVSSRHAYDKEIALRRAAQEGALLTTSEAVLFELLRTAKADEFKAISALVK